jgi:SOS-response transcriptional repressor LexA
MNEVGCIHTTQGYDLNYTAVIFGYEISYDANKDEIVINPEKYFDKNGKQSIKDPKQLKEFILNIYKTIMLRGIKGTYVYVCDPSLRAYFSKHIPAFEKEKVNKIFHISDHRTEEQPTPLYNFYAAAGNFSDFQNIAINEWVSLPNHLKYSADLFACRVIGDSMNKVIPNGSICLFRKYTGGSRDGKIVLVEHGNIQDIDTGSSFTVKEYRSIKKQKGDRLANQKIQLIPLSTNKNYQVIEIEEDELSLLKVIGVFECVLN